MLYRIDLHNIVGKQRIIAKCKMSSPSKRREMDLMKLMMSDYKVEMVNDGMQEFFVEFHGPNTK